MSVEMKSLYPFRIVNSVTNQTIAKQNRRQAAKALLGQKNRGFNVNTLKAEHNVNGQWLLDNETYALAQKYEAAQPMSNGTAKKTAERSIFNSMKSLNSALKVCISAGKDGLTEAHIAALTERVDDLYELIHEDDEDEEDEAAEDSEA